MSSSEQIRCVTKNSAIHANAFYFYPPKTKLIVYIDFSEHFYLYLKRPHAYLFYFLLILFDTFYKF